VFAYLAARFNYPEVLDGRADTVLPNLLAMGAQGRFVWALYAILPVIWIPAGVAAYEALAPVRRGTMRLALMFAVVAALAMMLGLMRWPTIHWHLAMSFPHAGPGQVAIAAIFDGLNTYLGNYIGEFLGELSFSLFFLLTSLTWLHSPRRTRWIGWLGVATAVFGLVGMFRNVVGETSPMLGPAVEAISAVNNYLLPAFMIVLGIAFIRWPAIDDSRVPNRE